MTAATAAELLQRRKQRLATAVSLGKPDKVPVALAYDAFSARVTGVKMSVYAGDVSVATKAALEAAEQLGDMDAIQYPTMTPAELSLLWLSRVDLPGKELPEDSLWQMHEQALMTVEDYALIVEQGYAPWLEGFIQQYLADLAEAAAALGPATGRAIEEFHKRGIFVFAPAATSIPYEFFCGGRSMKEFILDLHRIPDKVQAAMDAALPVLKEGTRQALRAAKPMGCWVGAWRSASEFLSPRLWERFVFPYLKEMVELVVEEGVTPVLHFDSNWGRDLERFKEFPRATCVLALDSATDIYRAKEVLGDHMCLLGDVPPRMLSLGTPDEVHEYASRLVREIGPAGFILAQGCCVPPDAKLDNVRAMVEAAHH